MTQPNPPPAQARTVEHMQSAYAHGRMDGERAATLATLKELDAWRIRRMNGMLKKDVWKGWNDETDFIEQLRQQAGEQE